MTTAIASEGRPDARNPLDMQEETQVNERAFSLPPSRGLSLGWRLALSTALIIGLVMGGISISQQLFEAKKDRQVHEELLKTSLAPLAVRLEGVATLTAMTREVKVFHAAYVEKGYQVRDVFLFDAAGKQILSTNNSLDLENTVVYLRAEIPISSSLLEGGKGTLLVLKDNDEYRQAARHKWVLWTAHFTVTVGAILLFLAATLYFQVTKPINRLVQGVRKMEMGYWGPIDLPGGAWEVRWLAWRFGNMVQEVRSAVTDLFEAEQKARSLVPRTNSRPRAENTKQPFRSGTSASDPDDSPAYQELLDVCNRLEAESPNSLQAVQLARSVWRKEVLIANRLGYHQLKARLEDAALRLMEPGAYKRLENGLAGLKESWWAWAERHRDILYRMLEKNGIPCVAVLHRVKHTAGVWAKMQSKGLTPDEVHDLFAFRVIVPTETDCYAALGVIHQAYKPMISRFKDYIARPKENGYKSLHTCLTADRSPVFEVQIRSVAMDHQAERGVAAHWEYKKHRRGANLKADKTRWWHRLLRLSGTT